jgi:hypothetical protein
MRTASIIALFIVYLIAVAPTTAINIAALISALRRKIWCYDVGHKRCNFISDLQALNQYAAKW